MAFEYNLSQAPELPPLEANIRRLSLASSNAATRLHRNVSAYDNSTQYNGDVYSTYNSYHLPTSFAPEDDQNRTYIEFPRSSVQSYVERAIDGVSITDSIISYLGPSLSRRFHPAVAVLLGMGGAGKTQVALKCCEKLSEHEAMRSLFWIDACTTSSIAKSFADIARKLVNDTLPTDASISDEKGFLNNIENTVHIVHRYLETHAPWTLVFDSYDRPEQVKSAGQLKTIRDYWPQNGAGAVLIVSRNRQCNRLGEVFEIGRMSQHECVEILRLYTHSEVDNEREESYLRKVARVLGCLPLAIDQAGAYIQWQGIGPKQFLRDYRNYQDQVLSARPQSSLWEYQRAGEEDEQTPLSVFTTWDMSLSCISGDAEIKKYKLHFICICAFLDPTELGEAVFKKLIIQSANSPPEWADIFLSRGEWSSQKFRNTIAEFRDLSLLENAQHSDEGVLFNIHPLVSEWIKRRISSQERDTYLIEVCHLLDNIIPESDDLPILSQSMEGFRSVSAHVSACSRNCVEYLTDCCLAASGPLQETGKRFAVFISLYGTSKDALSICDKALEGKEKHGEPWSYHYAQIALIRARWLSANRQWRAASLLLQEVRQAIESVSDISTEMIVCIGCQLGAVWSAQHRHEDARRLLHHYHDRAIRALGRENLIVAGCLRNLAAVYRSLGELERAQTYAVEARSLYQLLCGPDHVLTLLMDILSGQFYISTSRYEEAWQLHASNATKLRDRLGLLHPDTLRMYLSVAVDYLLLERLDDAFHTVGKVLEVALMSSPLIAGEAHSSLSNLWYMYGDSDRALQTIDIAISLFRRADALLTDVGLGAATMNTIYRLEEGSIEAANAMWQELLQEYEDQYEEADYFIEARIFWGMFLVPEEYLRSCDIATRVELRRSLDRAIHATQRAQIGHLTRCAHLRAAIRGYEAFGESSLVDKYSESLLSLWYKREEYALCPGPVDIALLEEARDVPLPSAITTICDALLEDSSNRTGPLYGILPFPSFFLQHGDRPNAKIAFEQLLSRDAWNANAPQDVFFCIFCDDMEGITAPIWHCMECPDVALHGTCYEKYITMMEPLCGDGTLLSGCLRHSFFKNPRRSWLELNEDAVQHDVSLHDWLQYVQEMYSGSNQNFRRDFEETEFEYAKQHFEDDLAWDEAMTRFIGGEIREL